MAKQDKEQSVSIVQAKRGRMRAYILGTSPLILNRLKDTSVRELLMPAKKKNKADRESKLKHNPYQEYRSSAHWSSDPKSPTLIVMPSVAFKRSMSTAALDVPGASKSQIGRLVWVLGEYAPIYGIPKLHMSQVRQAGMNRTPDIRTRAIVAEWASVIDIEFNSDLLDSNSIASLLANAGMGIGVGDYRGEKGVGNYGAFKIATEQEVASLMKGCGRKAQVDAFAEPEPYDDFAAELLEWFKVEARSRGFEAVENAERA